LPNKLIVAYTLRQAELPEELLVPVIGDPPKTHKKPEAIEKWKQEQIASFQAGLSKQPYTGTFDRLWIADPAHGELGKWSYRSPKSGKQPICIAARNWILKRYPNAWTDNSHPKGVAEAVFVGFNPKLFLKILGLECSLPANQSKDDKKSHALPLSMWYGHSDYRDIEEAAIPASVCHSVSWRMMLQLRGIEVEGWNGPGKDVEKDMLVATELAAQFNMISKD
jgi:hypothetical protein